MLSGGWQDKWYDSVCRIATKSPCLIPNENFKTEMIENVVIKLDGVSSVLHNIFGS